MEKEDMITKAIVSPSQIIQEPFKSASRFFEPVSGGFGLEIPPPSLRRPRSNTSNDPVSSEGAFLCLCLSIHFFGWVTVTEIYRRNTGEIQEKYRKNTGKIQEKYRRNTEEIQETS